MGDNKDVTDLRALSDNLDYIKEDVEDIISKTKTTLSNLPERKELSKAEISSLFLKIKEQIIDTEQTLLSETDGLFVECGEELEKSLTETREVANELYELKGNVVHLESCSKPNEDRAASFKRKYKALQDMAIGIQDKACCPVVTTLHKDKATLEMLKFGRFEMKPTFLSEDSIEPEPEDLFRSYTFATRRDNDIVDSVLTAVVWHNKRIVVTDKSNKKVKFFTEGGKFIHELLFSDAVPYGLCFVYNARNEDNYAVTFPKNNFIYLIGVSSTVNRPARVVSHFNTHVGYAGIVPGIHDATLIATFVGNNAPPRVDLIGYQGEIFKSFSVDGLGRPLFSFPRYVLVKGSLIILSDCRLNCVLFIDEASGAVVGKYRGTDKHPLVRLYDISLDSRGYVYVMDGKSGFIHVIDEQCRLIDLITETSSVLTPRLVTHEEQTRRLAITHGAGDVTVLYHMTFAAAKDIGPISRPLSKPEGMLLPPKPDPNIRSPSPGF